MLQTIRDAITGWLAYVVIAVLIVPFALWGIGDYLGVFGENYAAKVGDTEISLPEYRNAFTQRYQQLRDQYGSEFRADMIDEPRLRQETLEQMINEELLHQYALDRGYRVSDARVAREIHSIPAFQDNGVFQPERYRYMLQLNGLSPAGFERNMRRSLLIQQLGAAVSGTSFIPEQRFAALIRVADQRRELSWVEIPAVAFADRVEVTDEQVAEYFERNAGRYMTPETVTVEYIELTVGDGASQVRVDDEALRAFYDERRRAETAGDERRASHILITAEGRSQQEARALAEDLRARIEQGESFEALAREHSDDPGSAEQGGDLGWVERGMFQREFDNVLFELDEGEVSQPVRTGFGWHILRADEVRASDFPPFDEMRDELAQEYRQREAERRFYDRVDRVAELAFQHEGTLEPAAEAAGVEIQRREGVSRQSGLDARIRNAVFAPEVLEQGFNSQLIELDDTRVVIARVADRELPRQRELAEVAASIRDQLVRDAARRLAIEAGEQLVARATDGETLETLAEEVGGEWNAPRAVGRSDFTVPTEILDAAFRAPRPTDGEPLIQGLRAGDDYFVYQLHAVRPGSPEEMDDAQREGLMRALADRQGNAELEALLANLRANNKISYGSNLFDDAQF